MAEDFPGGKRNEAIFEMSRRSTEARAVAAIMAVHQLFPFGKKINLPNGEQAKIMPFVEPRLSRETGKPEFGFDIKAIDGSWHLECFVRQTGWGAVPAAEMDPIAP